MTDANVGATCATAGAVREVTYVTALHEVLVELMREDDRIIVIGDWEDPADGSNVFEAFGPERALMPPVSEMAFAGAAIGAALAGLRPIVTFSTASFMFNAWEQVVNEVPHLRYMSGGQVSAPVVLHCTGGARGAAAAQHSHSPQAALWNTPGLKLALPATPADLKGLFRTAVADPDPVFIVDHERLYPTTGMVPPNNARLPFGVGTVARQGLDVTVVATSFMVPCALRAAELVESDGVSAEVIDPRCLVPFDVETILRSVRQTGRLVVADETQLSCGVSAEIAARVGHAGFRDLKAPIERVATPDVPIPFSPALEAIVVPGAEHIADAIRRAMRYEE